MTPQRFRGLLEAVCATLGMKKASGEITDPEALLSGDALARLDARHAGVYAVLLFDPLADGAVAAYVSTGSLANDCGEQVLALYERLPRPRLSRAAADAVPGLGPVQSENVMLSFGRSQFPDSALELPGIMVVDRLASPGACVYIHLAAGSLEEVTIQVRKAMAMIAKALRERPADAAFDQVLGVQLAKEGTSYLRADGKSLKEHFCRLLRLLWASRRDLAALVPFVGKAFADRSAGKPP